jgi:hypothetical protein
MWFRDTQRLVSRKPDFNPCSKIFVELSLAVQSGTYRLWRHKRDGLWRLGKLSPTNPKQFET